MKKPPKLGTINGYIACQAKFGRKSFTFNGTLVDLIKQASDNGVTVGQRYSASFSGPFRTYLMVAAPHETRTDGLWSQDASPARKGDGVKIEIAVFDKSGEKRGSVSQITTSIGASKLVGSPVEFRRHNGTYAWVQK